MMKLFRLVALLALGACVHSPPPPPAADAGKGAETIPAAPSGVPGIPSASTPACARAEANLQRLQCRPEGFAAPGADRFAVLCERMRSIRPMDPDCLAGATTIAAVRECKSGVQCAESNPPKGSPP